METNNNDKLIRDFMLQQKEEVTDNFFTESVMRKIPAQQKNYEWIIVLLAAIGTTITLILVWNIGVSPISIPFPSEVNLYYILGGVFVSPFVVWFCFELLKAKHIRLF